MTIKILVSFGVHPLVYWFFKVLANFIIMAFGRVYLLPYTKDGYY